MTKMRISKLFLPLAPIALVAVTATAHAGWKDAFDAAVNAATGNSAQTANGLNSEEVATGLKQALAQGASQAVTTLGQENGFWGDQARRIPLPGFLQQTRGALEIAGYGPQLEQFQLTMNRAAEQATAEAGGIVRTAVEQMTVRDAVGILQGPQNAATEYLRKNSADQLFARIKPIVVEATNQTGVTTAYKNLASQAGPLLALSGASSGADLDAYVTNQAMDGLFALIAQEEANIRANPAARGSEILRKVFSRQ